MGWPRSPLQAVLAPLWVLGGQAPVWLAPEVGQSSLAQKAELAGVCGWKAIRNSFQMEIRLVHKRAARTVGLCPILHLITCKGRPL